MGPSGMGGGRMLRAVGRAVGAGVGGVKGALSTTGAAPGSRPARSPRVVTVSSSSPGSGPSSPSAFAAASSGVVSRFTSPYVFDGEEWEAVGGIEEEDDAIGFYDHFVFGPVPTREEAEEAVTTLQRIFVPVSFSQTAEDGHPSVDGDAAEQVEILSDAMERSSSSGSVSDWIEPSLQLQFSRTFQSQEHEKILDAFQMLQMNPFIQRVVVSLSSDKAVWDAVMKNEVVQELKKSFYEAENSKPKSSDEQPDVATRVLSWILDTAKARIGEFIEQISKIVNMLFNSHQKAENSDAFDGVLRSSFMLSVIVLIIVVVTRVKGA